MPLPAPITHQLADVLKQDAPKAPAGPSAPKGSDQPKPTPPKPADPAKPTAPKPADPPKPGAPAIKPADPPKPAAPQPPHSPEPRKSDHHWRDESERLQWEKTELALAKDDDSPFKKFGKGLKDRMHAAKDK